MRIKIYVLLMISLMCFNLSLFGGVGTETFYRVKELDTTKSYLDLSKIVITTAIENNGGMGEEKTKVCLVIDNKYRITDEKEIILLLLDIVVDINTKLNTK